jgi:hypothetical protein
MRQELRNVTWSAELVDITTEAMWDRFKVKIQAAMDKYVPWREVRSRGRPVWINHEIM